MRKYVLTAFLLFLLFGLPKISLGQKSISAQPDSFFLVARDLAIQGEYQQARKICFSILDNFPDYHDVRVLIGRSFAWEQKFDSARIHLMQVVQNDNDFIDAHLALLDVEIWSRNLPAALEKINFILQNHPENLDYRLKKAQVLFKMGDDVKAKTQLNYILSKDKQHKAAKNLLLQLEHKQHYNFLSLDYSLETFQKPYVKNLHLTSLEYSMVLKKTTFIAGFHTGFSNINNLSGSQIQLQAYPVINNKMYAFLNYSYGFKSIFPKNRAAFELYRELTNAFEVSGGVRYLQFGEDTAKTNIYIITGSISKYQGNYWFSIRPYLSPKTFGISQAVSLEMRRYFKDSKNYLFTLVSYGNTPDDPANNINNLEKFQLTAASFKIGYQDYLSKRLLFQIKAGLSVQEYQASKTHYPVDLFAKLYYLF